VWLEGGRGFQGVVTSPYDLRSTWEGKKRLIQGLKKGGVGTW